MRAPYFTRGSLVVLAVAATGILAYLARMVFGLQTLTKLNDQWPWGI